MEFTNYMYLPFPIRLNQLKNSFSFTLTQLI